MISSFTKLSVRERTLAIIVGSAVVILLNLVAIKFFLTRVGSYREELATQSNSWQVQQELLSKRDFWDKRDAWLNATQPKLANAATAGGQLLDAVQALAAKNHLNVQNPAINPPEKGNFHQSVSVTLQADGAWPDTITFLQQLQKPSEFIVVESAGVKIDPTDNTKIQSQLRIAKWYAL
jgi:hypothetical protein